MNYKSKIMQVVRFLSDPALFLLKSASLSHIKGSLKLFRYRSMPLIEMGRHVKLAHQFLSTLKRFRHDLYPWHVPLNALQGHTKRFWS